MRLLLATPVRTLATLAIGVVLASPAIAQGVIVDGLAATVGTHIIMLSDVRLARDLEDLRAASDETILTHLVDRGLMLAEVERFQQPAPPATAVESALAAHRARLGQAGWTTLMRRDGVDEAYIRAYVQDDLRLDTYLRQRFTALSEPSDEDVAAAFAARQRAAPDQTTTLEQVAPALKRELATTRFAALVAEWIAELRARSEVSVRGIPSDAGTGPPIR